jgi:hypothetical protein
LTVNTLPAKYPLTHPIARQTTNLLLLEDLGELGISSDALWLASLKTLGADLLLGVSSGVWVQAEKDLLVVEWVLLLDTSTLGAGITLGGADDGLDFRGVDQTANISLGDDGGWEEEVLLEGGWGGGGAVDLVKGLERSGGPDDEATEVATWSKLEEVQGEDGAGLDTGDVAESLGELLAIDSWVVDDQWATTLAVTAATELTLTSTELAGVLDLGDLWAGTDGVQETNGSGGLGDSGAGENLGVDDQWDLWDRGDLVTTGEEEGWDGRGSEGGSSRETLLAQVDLLVPLAPDLGWGEHATRAAHVTESGLTGAVSSTTGDTWDTGNSTTCGDIVSLLFIHKTS